MSQPDRYAFPLSMPRHAFNARDAARAGDVWRAFQEVAVEASSRAGWPPSRYRRERCAFVVRAMTVVHHLEAGYGEPLTASSWVSRFRREMLSTREVRLESARGPIASGTQEWAHVNAAMKPTRGSAALLEAFPVRDDPSTITLPAFDPHPGGTRTLAFQPWHVRMDPLAHANHPAYIDWCDENVSRALVAQGVDPVKLVSIAETVSYRGGVCAGEDVEVRSRLAGRAEHGWVFEHEITVAGTRRATAVTIRDLPGKRDVLAGAFDAPEA